MARNHFLYSGHEWKAAIVGSRASSTHVVCSECGIDAKIGEWPHERCNYRLAPLSWQPEHIQIAVSFDRMRNG